MRFNEKINATVGQLVNDLECHLEKYPHIASEIIYHHDGDDYPITVLPDICDRNHDYQGNYIEYVRLAFADDHDEEGITVAKMLEILKGIDANTGVLFETEPESKFDSGLRNMLPEDDGSFIQCYVDETFTSLYCWSDDEEIECLAGTYDK